MKLEGVQGGEGGGSPPPQPIWPCPEDVCVAPLQALFRRENEVDAGLGERHVLEKALAASGRYPGVDTRFCDVAFGDVLLD